MNKIFKVMLLVLSLFLWNVLTSCKDHTEFFITYELDGGSLDNPITTYHPNEQVILPTPIKEGHLFDGWYDNSYFYGESIEYIEKSSTGDKVFYAKWNRNLDPLGLGFNKKEFNGNGITFGIKVRPASNFDPFNEDYDKPDKVLKQSLQKAVETSYNVKIVYSEYGNDAAWGPDRLKYIQMSFQDKSFLKDNIYAVDISSLWIPSLVKDEVLMELYDVKNNSGFFKELNYLKYNASNEMYSVQNKVYGYETTPVIGDNYLYYNIDKIKELKLEDPAKLWFKGEWTWSNFDNWVKKAQENLDSYECAVDFMVADYVIGTCSAFGTTIVSKNNMSINFQHPNVKRAFDRIKYYYENNYQNIKHGTHDVTSEFLNGKTLLHTGQLWYLEDELRFNQDLDFQIGIVPYPIDDNQPIEVLTNPSNNGNLNETSSPVLDRNNDVLKTNDEKPIYGIDLAKTTYKNAITSNNNVFSIINYPEDTSLIPGFVRLNILHDLYNTLNDEKNFTSDIKNIVNYDIDYRIIMSVQKSEYLVYDAVAVVSASLPNTFFTPNWYQISNMYLLKEDPIEQYLNQYYESYYKTLTKIYE